MLAYYLVLFTTGFLILYAYRAVHIVTADLPKKWKWIARGSFLFISIFVYSTTAFIAVNRDSLPKSNFLREYTVSGAVTLAITLLSICIVQLFSDIALIGRYTYHTTSSSATTGRTMPRRKFMSQLALGAGAIMLGSFLWGTTKGKYGWRILRNNLAFGNLPKSFDGLKIVQISDLHLGSFNDNFEPLKEAVEMVNELEPDYIVFTGDMVNEDPNEARPWIDIFTKLKAKSGKYAILGNHDYGWGRPTEEEKTTKSREVAEITREMGFKVMLNEHDVLEKNGEKIGLVGVENWGFSEENWFPTRGDYKKSVEGMEDVPFKILLSHDPTHWDHHILEKEAVDLTLSGHTHGGQMGISIPGLLEISAGQLFYKRFAGAYKQGDQHLYVNRGMGFLIFPGRVGMPPEITLHVLNSA